jgi:hypothetical protein
MTHGVLPAFAEFEAAFDRECTRGRYEITCGAARNPVTEDAAGEYTARELYGLCARLADDWEGIEDGDCGAQLASAIMGTLGFEWI